MAGYVCTVAGGKGGVGKTTTAVNLAAALDASGYDVVVLDADLAMANLGALLDLDHDGGLHGVLAGDRQLSDVLTEVADGLAVVPGDETLDAFADADPENLRGVIGALRDAYNVVVVDTGAGLSHQTAVPLAVADGVVLVTTDDGVAVDDTAKTAQLADRVDSTVLGALVCRGTADTDLDAIAGQLDIPLLGVVPDDGEAAGTEPLVVHAPDSDAAAAYGRLAALLEEVFFEGADPADADAVFDPAWFDDAEDESGGRFSLFN